MQAPNGSLSDEQLGQLAKKGYLAIDLLQLPHLYKHYEALFLGTKEYFALEQSDQAKASYRAPRGPGASEEGFSSIPGEKQIYTCRSYSRTPRTLRNKASDVWNTTSDLLIGYLNQIYDDLGSDPEHGLPEDERSRSVRPYDPLVLPCKNFTEKQTPSLLRLFRYERLRGAQAVLDDSEDTASKRIIVAETHRDLGLLSFVVGSSPGLEVFDEETGQWHSIEEEGQFPLGTLTATLLAGQTLRYLSRNQYRAGVHRVRCAPASAAEEFTSLQSLGETAFRYSIVFALRPFPALLDLGMFENAKVGKFTDAEKATIDGQPASVLFQHLCGKHYNVNIARDIRDEQKKEQNRSTHHMLQDQNVAEQSIEPVPAQNVSQRHKENSSVMSPQNREHASSCSCLPWLQWSPTGRR